MIHKQQLPHKDKVKVIFEIPGTIWAERINLVGDFNHWDPESLPFRHNREENWQIELDLEAGCEYRFRYLFDGNYWRGDRQADKFIPNAHGGYDSIVIAEAPEIF
jgi:1,4-alpha-glucan branching enzyme